MDSPGDFIETYLEYVGETWGESPVIFHRWCAVSTLAACLQRKCWLPWGNYIYPNLFVLLVAESGIRKSTAMNPAIGLLRYFPPDQVVLGPSSTSREALVRRMSDIAFTYKDPREDNEEVTHQSITIFSPEFAVFVAMNATNLVENLTNWYDCDENWNYDTITHNLLVIPRLWVNLIGAITPSLVTTHLPQETIGGGLTSRMIFVYAEKKEKIVVFPPEPDLALKTKLLQHLSQTLKCSGPFQITEAFKKYYEEWYIESETNPVFDDPRFRPYMTRRASHLLKLSMIMNASRTTSMLIEEQDIARAEALLRETEFNMPKVFRSYGRREFANYIINVRAFIQSKQLTTMLAVRQVFSRDLSKEELSEIIALLANEDPPAIQIGKERNSQGRVGFTLEWVKERKEPSNDNGKQKRPLQSGRKQEEESPGGGNPDEGP